MMYARMMGTTKLMPLMRHRRSQNARGVFTLVDEVMPAVDVLMRISSRTGGATPRQRLLRLARAVEGGRLANERLEGGLINFFSFWDVDRAARLSVETRVEETGRIFESRALGEGQLHDILVGFASADDAVVRPHRIVPLPLLDDVRGCFLDELAHSAEGFPAPVPKFGDSFRDELRCRLALARARLFHVLILHCAPLLV